MRKQIKRKKIDFRELTDALSLYNNSWLKDASPIKEKPETGFADRFPDKQILKEVLAERWNTDVASITLQEALIHSSIIDIGLEHEFYINCLKKWIEKRNLHSNIILDANPEPQVIEQMHAATGPLWRDKHEYRAQCCITIQNLTITSDSKLISEDFMIGSCTITWDNEPSKKIDECGIKIIFKNNIFQPHKNNQHKCYVRFYFSHNSFIEFKDNVFRQIDVYIEPLYTIGGGLITLKGNKFKNKHISLRAGSLNRMEKEYSTPYGYIDTTKYDLKKHIEDMFNAIKVGCGKKQIEIEDIIPSPTESIVNIKDNRFNIFNYSGAAKFFFQGKNTIQTLKGSGKYVHFDSPQRIDPQNKTVTHHQELFSRLVEKAIENKDEVQEKIFKMQIERCAYQQTDWRYRLWLKTKITVKVIVAVLGVLGAIATIIALIMALTT